MTPNFQVGDKIKAGPFTADLGLTPGNIYTVHHIDDFGLVQPDAVRHHHFHPSHFELVERAAPSETYCLKDGDGDWWVFDADADRWQCRDRTAPWYTSRYGFERGVEHLISCHGIDDTPAAAPETYCLKDEAGDWWVSADGETFRWTCDECSHGRHYLEKAAEEIDEDYGIDAEPLPSEPDETYCLKDADGDWWVSDGTDHFLVTPRGTYPTKVTPEDAADSYGIEPAPLKEGDAVRALAQAIIWTREYVGEATLPAKKGWSWYDALREYAPEFLPAEPAQCTSLVTATDGSLRRCERTEHGHEMAHLLCGYGSWTAADEAGHITEGAER